MQETAFGDPRNGVFFVGVDKVSGKNIPKMLHIWEISLRSDLSQEVPSWKLIQSLGKDDSASQYIDACSFDLFLVGVDGVASN